MSIPLEDVDLSQVQTSFELDLQGKTITDCGWLEIINESDFTLRVNAGSVNIQVLAWECHPIKIQEKTGPIWQPIGGISFPVTITPRLLSTNSNQPYSTILTGVLYMTGEQPSSTTPRPLVRQAFIPNSVGTTTVGSTLINNGNTPLTNIVHIQPSDASPPNSNPTITMDNSGNVVIKSDNAGALTNLLQLIAGTSPEVIIAAANLLTQVVGNLEVDGIAGFGTSVQSGEQVLIRPTADANSGLVIAPHSVTQSAKLLRVQNSSFVDQFNVDLNGNVVGNGTYNGVFFDNNSGVSKARIGSSVANAGDIMDCTSTSLFLKSPSGGFEFQIPNGTTQWTRFSEHKFTGTGNGSFACGSPGSYDIALPNPCTNASSSQTIGLTFNCPTSVTTGNGLSWQVITLKF